MGIKDLKKIIASVSRRSMFKMSLAKFRGKRIGIDFSIFVKSHMIKIREQIINGLDLVDLINDGVDNQKVKNIFWNQVLNKLLIFLENSVTPVVVFDGPPPKEKVVMKSRSSDKEERRRIIEDSRKEFSKGNFSSESEMKFRRALSHSTEFTADDKLETLLIFSHFGIPCLQASGESDPLLAKLYRMEKIASVYSTDMDMLTYGVDLQITKMEKMNLECIRGDTFLEDLKYTHEKFVDMCILLGCDYNQRIPGRVIGPKKVIQRFDKADSIEELELEDSQLAYTNYKRCREIFSDKDIETLYTRIVGKRDKRRKNLKDIIPRETNELDNEFRDIKQEQPCQDIEILGEIETHLDTDINVLRPRPENMKGGREIIESYGLEKKIDIFSQIYSIFEYPVDGHIQMSYEISPSLIV